ncbi:Phytoene desaturase (lycopene-forming) [Pseudomonas sp. AD21]|nr:Phytoene desaturase (lycopene-forming) [Pseudomonas sp. AD21]
MPTTKGCRVTTSLWRVTPFTHRGRPHKLRLATQFPNRNDSESVEIRGHTLSEYDLSFKRALARGELDGIFDTIVIGSGAGGLSTAALLALEGQRVLVLERHAVLGGCLQSFERKGFEWDVGLHYIGEVHRKTSGLYRLFDKVSRGKLQWAPMPEIYNRIIVGSHQYDHLAGAQAYKDRLKNYFPKDAQAIDRYVELVGEANRAAKSFFSERAMPQSISELEFSRVQAVFMPLARRTVLEVLNELTDNADLKAVWCGNYGDYCNSPSEASFAIHAMVFSHYIDGASYPVGGAPRIAEAMADTVRSAGGACLVAAEVVGIETASGCVVGVQTAGGSMIRAHKVVSAIGISQTVPLLAHSDPILAQPLAEATKTLGTTQCFAVLNIGIDIPTADLNIHPANLWVHPSNDLPANLARYKADPEGQPMPLYFISHPSLRDPSWTERFPKKSTMDVCGLTDWKVFERFTGTTWKNRGIEYEDMTALLKENLLIEALKHYPQIRGRIGHTELATPLTFNHFLNRSHGNFMGYEQTPLRFAQRWMRAHGPVEGLYFSGQDVTAAGVSGAMVSGLVAASAILGRDLFRELRT